MRIALLPIIALFASMWLLTVEDLPLIQDWQSVKVASSGTPIPPPPGIK